MHLRGRTGPGPAGADRGLTRAGDPDRRGSGAGRSALITGAAVDAAVERFGRLDVVVANAGIETLGPVASMARDDAARLIEVDLLGVWTTVRVALPEITRARGYVLLVTSVAAATQGPFNWAYSAAKAGAA